MKCKICGGTGRRMEESDNGIGWIPVKCEYCNGTGKVEMTEQEYIQTCNTEQLTEELFQLCITVINHGGEFELKEEEIVFLKLKIKSWLKQHKEEKSK